MPAGGDITILAPNVIRQSALPRRWHKRGRFRSLDLDDLGLLARAFGIDATALASAPLHYFGMTGRAPDGYCLFAYPIYLHARREQLILMTGEDFEPDDAEAAELIAMLQGLFPDWRLERTRDGMWFLMLDRDPDIETTPLQDALGENIDDHLPRGGEAMAWHRTMNEVQMALFESVVNQRREEAGRPPVNSLWFWGGGRLPELAIDRWRLVVTNDPVAYGIARRAGIAAHWLDAGMEEAGAPEISAADTLWVYARPAETEGESPLLSPRQWESLRASLQHRAIERLALIDPGYGELTLTGRRARSWLPWR